MVDYGSLARALDQQTIADKVTSPHDAARAGYPVECNRTATFEEFIEAVTRYYIYHYEKCVAPGARLDAGQARSKVKQLLESRLHRGEGDILTYFARARDGLEGGLRVVLDTIAEALRAQAVADYVRDVFDRHVGPQSWEDKVELLRQFMKANRYHLPTTIHADQPERYAAEYYSLVNDFLHSIERGAAAFRRL